MYQNVHGIMFCYSYDIILQHGTLSQTRSPVGYVGGTRVPCVQCCVVVVVCRVILVRNVTQGTRLER